MKYFVAQINAVGEKMGEKHDWSLMTMMTTLKILSGNKWIVLITRNVPMFRDGVVDT